MASLSSQKHNECKSFVTELLEDNELTESIFSTFAVIWTKGELEGEIIDTLIRFLRKKECPVALVAPLIAFCTKRFFEIDLTTCKVESSQDTENYDPPKVCNALFEVFKSACIEVVKDLTILSLKEPQQPTHVRVHSIKNTRRKMEDRHAYYEDINTLFGLSKATHEQALFAVFDGHGGIDAANYAASQLICELKSYPDTLSDPGETLKKAIMQVDSKFVEKAKQDKLKSGCTAVIILIQGVNLTVGWLGDSQVVLCKDGQPIQLMEPHKPDRDDERERIEKLGGCVMFCGGWRVNGSLSVSRAIGDIDQKPFVTGEPDIEEYEMEGDEEFLIIACDGLWDTVEPVEAVAFVQKCITNGERDEVAEKLVNLAKDNGSLDNITVMVVYLDFNKLKLGGCDQAQSQEVS